MTYDNFLVKIRNTVTNEVFHQLLTADEPGTLDEFSAWAHANINDIKYEIVSIDVADIVSVQVH